ncbi:hypothetical protein DFH27DRAFT_617087 [Peziza echinospora]|nr:hypothetical protein DFH27DRAFT_617087 [Peziza echinospora]
MEVPAENLWPEHEKVIKGNAQFWTPCSPLTVHRARGEKKKQPESKTAEPSVSQMDGSDLSVKNEGRVSRPYFKVSFYILNKQEEYNYISGLVDSPSPSSSAIMTVSGLRGSPKMKWQVLFERLNCYKALDKEALQIIAMIRKCYDTQSCYKAIEGLTQTSEQLAIAADHLKHILFHTVGESSTLIPTHHSIIAYAFERLVWLISDTRRTSKRPTKPFLVAEDQQHESNVSTITTTATTPSRDRALQKRDLNTDWHQPQLTPLRPTHKGKNDENATPAPPDHGALRMVKLTATHSATPERQRTPKPKTPHAPQHLIIGMQNHLTATRFKIRLPSFTKTYKEMVQILSRAMRQKVTTFLIGELVRIEEASEEGHFQDKYCTGYVMVAEYAVSCAQDWNEFVEEWGRRRMEEQRERKEGATDTAMVGKLCGLRLEY